MRIHIVAALLILLLPANLLLAKDSWVRVSLDYTIPGQIFYLDESSELTDWQQIEGLFLGDGADWNYQDSISDLAYSSLMVLFWMKSLYLVTGSNGGWLIRKGSESKAGKSLHVSIDDGQALRFSFTNDHLDAA